MTMLRHTAFFEALGALEDNSYPARRVTAGLVVLRLVDSAVVNGRKGLRDAALSLRPVREVVEALSEPDVVRRPLMSIIDLIGRSTGPLAPESISRLLIEYGKALELDGRWRLAMDVFGSAAELDSSIAVDAGIMLGAAARRAGDWSASLQAYAHAVNGAGRTGNVARALQAEVGIANTYMAQGELVAADDLLSSVISEADELNLTEVKSLGLHSSASVAH